MAHRPQAQAPRDEGSLAPGAGDAPPLRDRAIRTAPRAWIRRLGGVLLLGVVIVQGTVAHGSTGSRRSAGPQGIQETGRGSTAGADSTGPVSNGGDRDEGRPNGGPSGDGDPDFIGPRPRRGSDPRDREIKDLKARVVELERELLLRPEVIPGTEADCIGRLQVLVEELRSDLDRATEQRMAREREWQVYNAALARFRGGPSMQGPVFHAYLPDIPEDATPEAAEARREAERIAERSREVERSLRTMIAIEGIRGIDLLQGGLLGEGYIGPVIFRQMDAHGHLAGSLYAERLRLQGSRTGRTLTLVLEDGYDSHSGMRVPFEPPPEGTIPTGANPKVRGDAPGEAALSLSAVEPVGSRGPGVRRIVLHDIDPLPWVEAMPELFGTQSLQDPLDDGRWNREIVRQRLNRLLREDVQGGYYIVRSLGGVLGDELREVHLEQRSRDGVIERRLFADRMRILPASPGAEGGGVQLLLREGSQERAGRKTAFLEGRYRIFLPRADYPRWRREGLPGLGAEPESSGPPSVSRPEGRGGAEGEAP